MNAYMTSLIRTFVPIGVGYLSSWLLSFGINVGDSTRMALVSGIGAVLGALYYAAARWVEQKWPVISLLLASGAPSYPTQPAAKQPEAPSES